MTITIRRREMLAALGSATMAWPLAVRAQQGDRVRLVGVLHSFAEDDREATPFITAFQQKLQQLGWAADRNIRFEHRFGANDTARYRTYAAELVGLAPDVIVATNTPTLQALQQRSQTIPIVFYRVSDPVGDGFIKSLAHPGGNITGFANQDFSMAGKWLQLLKDVAPNVDRAMVILDPENPTWRGYFHTIESMAPSIGIRIAPTPVIDAAGIERALGDFAREPKGSLVVLPGPVTRANQALIAQLAANYRLPAVYGAGKDQVRAGGLMTYGPDLLDQVRNAAGYVARILKGEKPGDLPVQRPTKFELVINLKTARALNLDISPTLLARADEVIE